MSRSALSGLRVIDFTHMIAGPYGAQLLAYFGAQVIKVESVKHPDGFRRSGYGVSGAGINASRAFAEFNRNKLNVTVNMATEEGRDVVRRLVAVSDVVMENFSRSVMERWGMEYAGLRRVRPDLVMVSLQGMGQRGPKRDWVTWGPSLMPYAGLTTMWGYPDQPEPVGSQIAFPDYVVSTQMAFVVL
ncbi:MAG: CoA transferase, partial [Chloroflexota bacterium]